MSFNKSTNRTPDEVVDKEAVATRSKAIKLGLACFVMMAITNGAPIASLFFLGGVVALFYASQINTRRKKKGEAGFY